VAYAMVTQYGMSDKLGNVDLASNYSKLSTSTKELIEQEVRRLIEEGRTRTTALLVSKRKELDLLAKALVDYESLNREEAFKVIKGQKLEGKMVMPSGAIKIPNLGGLGGAMPEVPPIPGSVEDKPPASKEPPAGAGGAIA
jgi:ATP-dependent metalloprotease